MQTAGGSVRAAAEFAARVQLGEDHLQPRQSGARLNIGGDASAVVLHLYRTVTVQNNLD